ncbi:ABC-type xylose transport system permease subunit [Williamsia limnetica]|uniref:Autoinducer 2 import system permease protein LsrD n=1 Tax=Williamsia limnetica TaxID=882452 RepID=A0A318RCN7_WILLI|nr:ABC transporter permease [Williamsia limnetica]PYE12466.1 ABC-type xylose transport system permease subunit [Williamsia limnetica]
MTVSPPETPTTDKKATAKTATETAGTHALPSAFRRLVNIPVVQASFTFVAFLVIFAIFGLWLGSKFLDVNARILNIHQSVPLLLLGLAAMTTLVCGMFDLSVASMASLCAFLAVGLRADQGLPFLLVIAICLGVGALGGLINGLLVEKLKVNAFIATLGTGGVLLGLSSVYSDGAAIIPTADSTPIPEWFTTLGAFTSKLPFWVPTVVFALLMVLVFNKLRLARPQSLSATSWTAASAVAVVAVAAILFALGLSSVLDGITWLVGLLLVVGVLLWTLVDYTVYGRNLKASGSNAIAARLAGIRTSGVVIRAFVLGGVLAAGAGVVLSATQGSASPDIAGAYLLPAFAAAFLSTVVFSTGRFTVWGTLAGGIFVVWVSQALIAGGLPPTWTNIVNGGVLLIAVALSTAMRRSNR